MPGAVATRFWLFVYGALRDPAVQRRVFGRELVGTPDALAGFALHDILVADAGSRDAGRVHPILRPSSRPGLAVSGRTLQLSPEDLARADAYEGLHHRRIPVTLVSGRGAFVYVEAAAGV
jgi:hypothetical protein